MFLNTDLSVFEREYDISTIKDKGLLAAYEAAKTYATTYPATADEFNEVRWNLYAAELKYLGLKVPAKPFETKANEKPKTTPTVPAKPVDLTHVEVFGTEAVKLQKSDKAIVVESKAASNTNAQTITIKAEKIFLK